MRSAAKARNNGSGSLFGPSFSAYNLYFNILYTDKLVISIDVLMTVLGTISLFIGSPSHVPLGLRRCLYIPTWQVTTRERFFSLRI